MSNNFDDDDDIDVSRLRITCDPEKASVGVELIIIAAHDRNNIANGDFDGR